MAHSTISGLSHRSLVREIRQDEKGSRAPKSGEPGKFDTILESVSGTRKVEQQQKTEDPARGSAGNQRAEIDSAVFEASLRHGVPQELVHAVITAESNYKPHARSHVGAQGLMQIMPGTARELGVKNAYDIRENIDGGTKYLRQLLDRFDGNVAFAVAAYNAGPHRVEAKGGIPNIRETQNYVPKVLAEYRTNLETSNIDASRQLLASLDVQMAQNISNGFKFPASEKTEESEASKAALEPPPYAVRV